jgi:hypothetical protein
MKPLAKSLHTVTVLVAIARAHRAEFTFPVSHNSAAMLVDYAVAMLNLQDSPDVYGLRAQAITKLSKGN